MKEIFWLVSYPKSGSTWVRAFLDAYWMGKCDISRMVGSLADNNLFWLEECPEGFKDLLVESQILVRDYILLKMVLAYKREKRRFPLVVKTHNVCGDFNGQPLLPRTLTKGLICLVRDPRDILPSYADHFGMTMEEATRAMMDESAALNDKDRVPDITSSWSMHTRGCINAARDNGALLLRYEDLKNDPVFVFSRILIYFGHVPDLGLVSKAVEESSIGKLMGQEDEKGFRERPEHLRGRFFGGSHEQPDKGLVGRLIDDAWAEMNDLGYEVNDE